jgi:zinc transport system substrate-binding protein
MKRKLSLLLSGIILISLFVFSGCEKSEVNKEENATNKKIVAVSIVPQETFVKAICGDKVEVITMIPPGSSPETYEPTPQQMQKFTDSDIYFSIGVPTEAASILPTAGDVKIVPLAEKVSSVYDDLKIGDEGRDAHIWLSPKRVKVMVEAIAEEMGKLDEENKELYNQNAENYIKQLDELDKEIKDVAENIKQKKFVVFHPAFGYIADDYGLEMFSLEEEGKEATPQHLQDMIDLAKKENIKVIFYQAELDSNQAKAYAEEVGGKTEQLEPLAADYIENLKKMINTIAEANK